MLETKHIEYKQKATPELEKEVVAFLNSEGGTDQGNPTGFR